MKPDRNKTAERMCLSEHPFGTIKRAMGFSYFRKEYVIDRKNEVFGRSGGGKTTRKQQIKYDNLATMYA